MFKGGLLVLIMLMLASPVFAASQKNSLQIKGSDTMVNLVQSWAEEFNKEHPGANISVTGGGSGTGIAAMINGSCDIAASSRSMKDREIKQAEANKIEPVEHVVALDGIVVVAHPGNPIKNLTLDQLRDIFMGKIKNWKEVGGQNKEIVILSREVNSGTHVFFKEHVLRRGNEKGPEEFAPEALLMSSSQAIADEVAQNPNAIGYYGMGYISSKQKVIAVAKVAGAPYIEPSIETVVSKQYPISRPLFMYTKGQPEGTVKEFIDFAFSKKGQEIVRATDFVPVK
ncbi:MAG: phosphate ABC transporter substrate-binding protein [Candidatus Omnitrophota bacterium]|nr:phosphate ABC transporter substrate-binding protein [Candidatus Omnitrophota bacterium]